MGRFRSLALGVLMVIGLNVPAWADDEQVFFVIAGLPFQQ